MINFIKYLKVGVSIAYYLFYFITFENKNIRY
ncbi:hypothetical protein SAMN06264346_11032 [Chryseobacterium profundimaris]|uniref:Uncharacterized protein n=1 Tax=Chryseobacterium profundimaris TaxID=1387275 RepID=A0ABY1P6X8_9FLAO|nr:hypothetical protein SAMN06264346_11032 [Chryseobacterium profundimaris]